MKKGKEYILKSKEDGLSNIVKVEFKEDGAIVFVGEDVYSNFIYLYPKQAKKLIKLIKQKSGFEDKNDNI